MRSGSGERRESHDIADIYEQQERLLKDDMLFGPPTNKKPLVLGSLGTSYHGGRDTIKCVEVDTRADRVYAASSMDGVYVWELSSCKPLVLLPHPQWVNALCCFPPLEERVDEGDGAALYPSDTTNTAASPFVRQTELVLTGCEDGIVTTWCPVTYTVKAQYRPGHGPITHMNVCTVDSGKLHSSALCFALSLEHLYVIQVKPQLDLLMDFLCPKPGVCLASFFNSYSKWMLVGQEDGSIVCWDVVGMTYDVTLPYPTEALDDNADTTAYTVQPPPRFSDSACPSSAFSSTHVAPPSHAPLGADTSRYRRYLLPRTHVPSMSAYSAYTVTERLDEGKALHFDHRRVTCLASNRRGQSFLPCFFSGHANGEVLIWEASRGHSVRPIKKIRVFSENVWVWSLIALDCKTYAGKCFGKVGKKAVSATSSFAAPSGTASARSGACGEPCLQQVVVFGDNGSVMYMQSQPPVQLLQGPGFLSTAGYYWRGHCASSVAGSNDITNETQCRHYLMLGSFEGRLERLDVTSTVSRLVAMPRRI